MALVVGDGVEQAVMPVGVRGSVPNDRLRLARLRCASASGSGRALSRQELADLASRLLDVPLSGDYIGRLERGEFRWPRVQIRRALRQVLQAENDADLGFFIVRAQPTAVVRSTSAAGAALREFTPGTETLEVAGMRVSVSRGGHVSMSSSDDTKAQVRVQFGQVLIVIEAVSGPKPQPPGGEAAETGEARVISLTNRRPR